MKKLLEFILALSFALSLTACRASETDIVPSSSEEDIPQEEEVQLNELAQAAIFATQKVKDYLYDNLKSPQSLAINSIKGGFDEELSFLFEVDYSAQNGFGGADRDRLYINIIRSPGADGGFAVTSYVDKKFYGSQSQMYTRQFYEKLAVLGEIFFAEDGVEYPVETVTFEPEEYAGQGIFNFNVVLYQVRNQKMEG